MLIGETNGLLNMGMRLALSGSPLGPARDLLGTKGPARPLIPLCLFLPQAS